MPVTSQKETIQTLNLQLSLIIDKKIKENRKTLSIEFSFIHDNHLYRGILPIAHEHYLFFQELLDYVYHSFEKDYYLNKHKLYNYLTNDKELFLYEKFQQKEQLNKEDAIELIHVFLFNTINIHSDVDFSYLFESRKQFIFNNLNGYDLIYQQNGDCSYLLFEYLDESFINQNKPIKRELITNKKN